MGLLCHEYAHTLGLVDMYDTDGAESGGVGAALLKTTSLMDQGMFNACGCLPPNFNAIELEMLGIAEAEELTVGVHILPPIGSKKKFYRLDTPLEGEYFLFECRKEDGWDKASGYQGLFAYHIDKSANDAGYGKTAAQRWQSLTPTVNANKNHQCAYLKVLSNSFTPVSDPAFVSWNGTPSPLCIDDIKVLKDGSVSFNVVAPLYVESKAVFQDALILKWNDISCTGSKCYVRWKDENGLEHTIDVDPYEVGKYSHTFEGLSPETEYVFAIYQLEGYDYTSVQVVTWPYGGRPFIYLPEVGRNASGSFQYGAELPLRVVNAPDLESVEWYFNDASISVSGNGYWKVTSSGTLKAVLTYLDGGDEVIEKRLKVE